MKRDGWITFIFILGALFLRLPFASKYLYHWDSVNYALSLENYDVRLHQPHPPGYFLYSMLGKLFNLIFNDANTSLVAISVVFGALGIGALYWFGLKLVDRPVGLATAFIGLSSPLLWYESEVALNYTLDFFLVTILGLLVIKQWQGNHNHWFWTALWLGITGGVRLHDIVFLGPLWLLSLIRLSWKQRILSVVTLIVVSLVWFIPMTILSGGLKEYISAFLAESSAITSEASLFVLDQFGLNGFRLGMYLVYGVLAGWLPLVWGLSKIIIDWRKGIRHSFFVPFFLWIAPAALFFVFIHIRQAGHVVLLLPALFLLAGWSVIAWGRKYGKRNLSYWLIGGLCLVNVIFFMAAPKALFGSNRLPLQTPSRTNLMERDQFLADRFQFIQSHFDPITTAVIAGGLNIRHPDYYLREFQRTDLSYRISEDWLALPPNVNTLILFDDQIMPEFTTTAMEDFEFPDGSKIRIIRWNNDQQLWINSSGVEIRGN
jgi:4-amino-4-deoxy-L-arabinose transferase-like glycosyltransferase